MDAPRAAMRLGVVAAAAVLVGLVAVSLDTPGADAYVALTDPSGSPLTPPTEPGFHRALWKGNPVAVLVVPAARLDGVEALRGDGEATPSVEVPGHPDLRIVALSAKSTHLGCTVGFNTGLGASIDVRDYDGDGLPDGRMLDPCHHGQWDVYHRGIEVPGTATGGRMAVLDVSLSNGLLTASHFDGPIGPQGR
ncbi:MAG: Rieske (2Fe-2S) protein [Thermoplasmatota archaeon]